MDLLIKPIEITPGWYAYVITVRQSSVGHQAPDGKYYKRYNFSSVPMADYEVRDVMRRATAPELVVEANFEGGKWEQGQNLVSLDYPRNSKVSKPVIINLTVKNLSNQPAEYGVLLIYLDQSAKFHSSNGFDGRYEQTEFYKRPCIALRRPMGLPSQPPLFKEHDLQLGSISITVHSDYIHNHTFMFAYEIRAPGFRGRGRWPFNCYSEWLCMKPAIEWPES
jgi:hypothetical protein